MTQILYPSLLSEEVERRRETIVTELDVDPSFVSLLRRGKRNLSEEKALKIGLTPVVVYVRTKDIKPGRLHEAVAKAVCQ